MWRNGMPETLIQSNSKEYSMWRLFILFGMMFLSCHSVKEVSKEKEHFAQAEMFQLTEPKVLVDSVLFIENAKVELVMDFPETEIRYRLDGSPVTRNSTLYKKVMALDRTAVLKARSFHSDCQSSEPAEQNIYKVRNVFEQATVVIKPSVDLRYPGNGVSTLTDLQKGTMQFRDGNHWLGFQKDTLDIQVDFLEKESLESIVISTLANEIAWIFLPNRIELLDGNSIFCTVNKEDLANPSKTGLHFIPLDFPERELKKLTIRVFGEPLPKGHNGYGGIAWFFVDEIFTPY